VNVASDAVEKVGGQLRSAAALLFTGVLAAACLVGGFITLSVGAGGRPLVGWLAIGVGGLLALGGVILHLAPVHLRKIQLRRWLKKR
jgi:ubiquinone biosynthesis protein